MGTEKGEVTVLLDAIRDGNDLAKDELLDVVYLELRNIAKGYMSREKKGISLQTTALINEAYLRLFDEKVLKVTPNHRYFFQAAATAIQRILVDRARKRRAAKRGGNLQRVPLDDLLDDVAARQKVDLLDLDEALAELKGLDRRGHEIVVLRFFSGLQWQQIADTVQASLKTVQSDWQNARAWLFDRLRTEDEC